MALTPKKVLAIANKYTDETVIGGGAIKGKNCVVEQIEKIEGYTRVHFKWTLDDGTVQRNYADLPDGVGISTITFKEQDASGNNVYTITLSDNSTYDFTAPKGPKGDSGSGGGGGTSDYTDLTNKPSINGVELLGNKTVGLLSTNIQINADKIGYSGTVSGASTAKEAIEALQSSISDITASTTDITAGTTALTTGDLYLVYE